MWWRRGTRGPEQLWDLSLDDGAGRDHARAAMRVLAAVIDRGFTECGVKPEVARTAPDASLWPAYERLLDSPYCEIQRGRAWYSTFEFIGHVAPGTVVDFLDIATLSEHGEFQCGDEIWAWVNWTGLHLDSAAMATLRSIDPDVATPFAPSRVLG